MLKNTISTLLIVVGLACVSQAQEAGKSGAKLFIDDTSFDFGYIHSGSVVSHSYVLHSRGTDSLKILKVQPGCGCTKAPLKKEVVAAGDSTEVELVFTSSKGANGTVSKSATVSSNDNDRASFQLSFKAKQFADPDSLTPLTLSAGEITFDGQSGSKEAKLIVKNVSANALKMHLVSCPLGYLSVNLPEAEIKPGKEKEIKVKLSSSITEDQFKKSFTFVVDDLDGTRYTIPVAYSKSAEMSVMQQATSKTTSGGK